MFEESCSLGKNKQSNEATIRCLYCQKNIIAANYQLHEARCRLLNKRIQPPSKELFNEQSNKQIKLPPKPKNRAASFREQPEQKIQQIPNQEYPGKGAYFKGGSKQQVPFINIDRIREIFLRYNYNGNSHMNQQIFYNFLSQLSPGQTYDRHVADELWNKASNGSQFIQVNSMCQTISDGIIILQVKLDQINDEIRLLGKEKLQAQNSVNGSNRSLASKIQSDISTLHQDREQFEKDLSFLTLPFGINLMGRNSQFYRREYNRGKQMPYESRNSFQHVKAPLVDNRINQQDIIACHFCGFMQNLAELDSHPQQCSHKTNHNNYSIKNQPKIPPKQYVALTKYEAFNQVAKNNINGNGSKSPKRQQKSNHKLNEQEKHINIRNDVEKEIPAYLLCPITYNLMIYPMILSSCGHTFEQVKIKEWLVKQRKCPLCSKEASQQMLVKNLALAQACDSYR